ncbi:MAG TPA: TlpA disulfide reductase family protein [Blastocatellia bacterium]|nr:TlpA disulfide reductase family protein [Blastocatellia bacterium]
MRFGKLAGLVLSVAVIGVGATHAAPGGGGPDPVSGRWKATLTIPSGEVAFGLDLKLAKSLVSGAVLNGSERQDLSGGSFDGTTLELRMDYYDGRIIAHYTDATETSLVGEYTRQTRNGIGRYEFKAARTNETLRLVGGDPKTLGAANLSGDWVLTTFEKDGKVEEVDDATFTIEAVVKDHAVVSGTVIPVSGDYGLLSGVVWNRPGEKPTFRLSRFDGIHVTLLTGEVRDDGSLAGELATGLSYRAPFTAVRKARAAASDLPGDPNALTTVKDPQEAFAFALPDTDGRTVSLTDDRYKGKVVVIDIMGTWCPNCHDETPLLVDLYRKYRADGLEIVMLAYEYTPDAARSRRQIAIYREKYGIEFPILVAGSTAEGEIARTLPQLVNFGAYPTTIFVGRDGRVHRIHAGFSGPATGDRFGAVKKEMEELVRELLAGKP